MIIASNEGRHRVELRALKKESAGTYRLDVAELHTATPRDRQRVSAQQAYTTGEELSVKLTRTTARSAGGHP